MPRRRTLALLGGALVGAAAWYLAVKDSHDRYASPVRHTTRARRTAELARIGARAGSTLVTHKARLALTTDESRRAVLAEQHQLRTAEQVAEVLGNMKGALMKLGQMASYIDQSMPEPMRDALAQLQADAPPMAPELAIDVVERQLGSPLDVLFAEFDERPLASASIGQVHRAVTRDGRVVAVKVQYPGVGDAVRADLGNTSLVVNAISMLFPGLDPGPLAREIQDRLLEELDYELEASNQRLFAEFYDGHPFIHVPAVVDELSTACVLTTELASGVRFDEARAWSQEQRDLAGETIYRFVFRSLWHLHAFNGDPHPGNYLFEPDGRVTFLDFGLVKRFQPADLDAARRMLQAWVLDRDVDEFRRAIVAGGFLRDVAPEAIDEDLLREYHAHWYDPIVEDATYTMTPEWSSASLRRYFDVTGPFGPVIKASNLPPQYVILQRINLGLFAVLGELRATRNYRRIIEEIWPFVLGPPSTDLGRLEAEWWTTRGHRAWDE